MSACRSCRAEIWWAETTAGKRIPVDAEPTPDGNLAVVREGHGQAPPVVAVAATPVQQLAIDALLRPRYTSHFATCPNAAQHRRKP